MTARARRRSSNSPRARADSRRYRLTALRAALLDAADARRRVEQLTALANQALASASAWRNRFHRRS